MSSQNLNLNKIEHIVVLMMENRSFDNVLGRLYPDNPNYNGVNDAMSNPRPDGEPAYVFAGTDMTAPYPDPNEPYNYVYMQQFNPPSPPSDPPFPPPCPVPLTEATPDMQGFVKDYANAISQANIAAKKHGRQPFNVKPDLIMNCYEPGSLPVINGLARAYAVCDHWFSSVPTQTFPNRSFVHAATSSGNVFNSWGEHFWDKGIFINDTPTIYNLLEAQKISWKIYHGGPLLLCNVLYGQRHLWEFLFDVEHPRFFPLQAGDYSDLKLKRSVGRFITVGRCCCATFYTGRGICGSFSSMSNTRASSLFKPAIIPLTPIRRPISFSPMCKRASWPLTRSSSRT